MPTTEPKKKPRLHKKLVCCPICNFELQRIPSVIQKHFLKTHKNSLSLPEAHRIASLHTGGSNRTPYAEGLKRHFCEVQGGLPSLGRRR